MKLGELANFRTGKLNSNAAVENGIYPFFTCSPEVSRIDTYAFDEDAVLLAGNNANGDFNVKRYNGKFNAYQRTYVITVKEGLNIDYLYYSLQLSLKKFKQMSQGTATKFLTVEILRNFEINCPSFNLQCAIAAILSCLDAKIANNTAINHRLEQIAQAVFKSWFVDFEPWGGVMPRDWKNGCLGDIGIITSGKRPPLRQSTLTNEANVPLVGASSVMGYTNIVLYNEKILVTGRVGTHGIVQRFSTPCWTSDNTLVIKSDFYEFAYQQLLIVDFYNMNRGSTQPLITQTDLKNVPIILPEEKILIEFEEVVGLLMVQYENNNKESAHLAATRDVLLPKLISGEIEVEVLEWK